MSLGVFNIPGSSLIPSAGAATTRAVQPVAPVTRDRPAPDRHFDATGTPGSGAGGGVAALLLQRGGAPAVDASAATDATQAAPKPNLDELNRVLAHYVAQSTAAARLRP